MREDGISMLDYLIVVLRRKRLIASVTSASMALAAIVSLLLPKAYRAEAKILPPQRGGGSMAVAQLLGSFPAGLVPSALDLKSTSDLYAGMLRSRTAIDRITDRFGLMRLYKEKYREDMRERLARKILSVSTDRKNGIITIQVEDRDPARASEMANAFVEELKSLNAGLAIGEAAQRRLFYEEQLKEVRASLSATEDDFKNFQERTGALRVEEQAKSIIEGVAELRAQIAAKEVELRVMRTYATGNNPDLQRQEETLSGLKAELKKLESKGGGGPDPLMPTGRMPSVGTEYIRKLREVKFNETLYGLISAQHETAKLDEAKDAYVIQVIDSAVPPEKKSKPKRAFITLAGGLAGFFASVLAAFFIEYIERAPENGEKERLDAIRRHLNFKT